MFSHSLRSLIGVFLTLAYLPSRAEAEGNPRPRPAVKARAALPAAAPSPLPPRIAEPVSAEEAYQDALVARARAKFRLTPEPSPEGKSIERILIVTNDVVDDRDPWPSFANYFHSTTDTDIVEREVLFKKGELWHQDLIAETERNLRSYLVLSMAQIVAAKGSAPGKVVALVVTKDLWSLRTNFDFTLVGPNLQYFTLQLTEENLAGRMKMGALNFNLDLATLSFGEQFTDPRVGGSRVSAAQSATIFLNRGSGAVEGGGASLDVGQPLYSLDTKWAWGVNATLLKNIYRQFSGNGVLTTTVASTGEAVPYTYAQRGYSATALIKRSFGHPVKQDVGFGWRGSMRLFEIPPGFPGLQPASLASYMANILPRSENAGTIFFNYSLYRSEYIRLMNIESYGLTEDYQMGPRVFLETRLANPVFGFDSSYLEQTVASSCTWDLGDDYFVAGVTGEARYQNGVVAQTPWINERVSIGVKNVSPRFGFLRFFAGLETTRRFNDQNHNLDTLGGGGTTHSSVQTLGAEAALRGYPDQYFTGSQIFTGNLEFRTDPLLIRTIYIGAVAFFDFGGAFNDPAQFLLHESVGAGLRLVFPQFTRQVLRIDLGFPMDNDPAISPVSFVLKFGQAF